MRLRRRTDGKHLFVTSQPRQHVGCHALYDVETIGTGRVDDELIDAGLTIAVDDLFEGVGGGPGIIRHDGRPAIERADDGVWIAPDASAGLVQDLVALGHLAHAAGGVPGVGVARHDPEHAWSFGAEDEGRTGMLDRCRTVRRLAQLIIAAVVARRVNPKVAVQQLDRFAEAIDQLTRLGEVEPEHGVLGQVPAGAEAQLQATVRDMVDGDRLPRQESWMAEGVRADQDADASALGLSGQGRQERPAFEVGAVRMARLNEMIAEPKRVVAELLEVLPALDVDRPAQILIGADAEP